MNQLARTYRALGWRQTLHTYAMRVLERYFGLHLYRVVVSGVTQIPAIPQLSQQYETRVVNAVVQVASWVGTLEGFDDLLVNEAFANGDICAVNLYEGKLVGYGFTSTVRTRVTAQIFAVLPPNCRYGYAAYTASDHRNRRLAQARWLARMAATQPPIDERSVAYIATDNFASLAMYYQDGVRPHLHGYVGFVRWRGREYPFNSRAARRLGFQFVRAEARSQFD